MTNGNLRVGLIGAGGIARIHSEHLRALDGVEITAVADVSADRAEALAADCGAEAFTDHRELLDEVDAVYVWSPPIGHREHVTAAVAARRHVFCEKPLATTLEDGRAIADAASSGGVHSMATDHRVTRFEEALQIIRPLLDGRTVTFDGRYHRAHEARLVPTPGRRIPILVAAGGPRMLRLAARYADAWNGAWFGTPDDSLLSALAALDAALAAEGRDP